MMLNYHEMTMNQPANDPAKRQQFVVITTVMIAVLAYSLMTSGTLMSIDPTVGIFPGGYYCYKLTARDYAASFGLARSIRKEVLESEGKNYKEEDGIDVKHMEYLIYHIYLDNPMTTGGRGQRWATGIMGTKSEINDRCDTMLSKNKSRKQTLTQQDRNELPAREYFEELPAIKTDLPSVDALVLQFPHTYGFVSALTTSYKVIPALRNIAKSSKHNIKNPVVITTCSKEQEMCTHYVPLVETEAFMLGQPDSETHNANLGEQKMFMDWNSMKTGLKKLLPSFAKDYVDMLP